MKTQLKNAFACAFVLGCLLSSCARADETPEAQGSRESSARAGSPSSAESSDRVVFTKGQQSFGDARVFGLAMADVDCDGDIDAFLIFARLPNRIWVNNGHGLFTRSDTEYGGRASKVMTVADFNGDNFLDLFFGFLERPGEVWFNDGSGNFRDTQQPVGDQVGCDDVIIGDIDGDGDIDLVVSSIENGIGIWLNQDETGIFAEKGSRFAPGTIKADLLDADADGDLDLIAAHIEEGNRLWLNTGSGKFTPTDQFLGTTWAFCFAVGRIDSDDDLDVVIGNEVDGLGAAEIYFCE